MSAAAQHPGLLVVDLTASAPAGAALALAGACSQLLGARWTWEPAAAELHSHGVSSRRPRTVAQQQQQTSQQQTLQQQGATALSQSLLTPVEQVLAGAVARTAAQVVIHPLDTIKTRLQVASGPSVVANPQLAHWHQGFTRACQALKAMDATQLLRGARPAAVVRDLYTGLAGAVGTVLPAATIFFAVDHACKELLCDRLGLDRRAPLVHVGSASVAALASCVVRVPGDVIKHRVQAYRHANVAAAAQHAWRHGGLFSGFGATLMRDVPEMAIQFAVYEGLSKALTGSPQHHPLLVGGVAGALAAVATAPLDCIKAQVQCGGGACNAWLAVRNIVAARGPAGLFAGLAPRVLQTSVQSATFFTLYEALKGHLQQQHNKQRQQQHEGPHEQQQQQLEQQQRSSRHRHHQGRITMPHLALAHASPLAMLTDTKQPLKL